MSGGGAADEPGQARQRRQDATSDSALDDTVVSALRQLASLSPDERWLQDAVTRFEDEATAHLGRLRSAAGNGDATQVAVEAHALGGLSASFGAQSVARLCAALERTARGDDLASVPATIARLDMVLPDTQRRLRQMLSLSG